jgi:hypothetical protein
LVWFIYRTNTVDNKTLVDHHNKYEIQSHYTVHNLPAYFDDGDAEAEVIPAGEAAAGEEVAGGGLVRGA